MVISDGGSHFIDKTFRKFLKELGAQHTISTPYHPRTSSQAETSKKQIKNILQKTVQKMGKSWKTKLLDPLWAYRTAYKTPLGVYGKTCYLPVELEHRAHWAIRKFNMNFQKAGMHRKQHLSKLEEWRDKANHSAKIYKEKIKKWHDKKDQPERIQTRR